MTKFELIVSGLAGISLIGLILLMAMGRDINALLPIVTALISYVLGLKSPQIVRMFKK